MCVCVCVFFLCSIKTSLSLDSQLLVVFFLFFFEVGSEK